MHGVPFRAIDALCAAVIGVGVGNDQRILFDRHQRLFQPQPFHFFGQNTPRSIFPRAIAVRINMGNLVKGQVMKKHIPGSLFRPSKIARTRFSLINANVFGSSGLPNVTRYQ